MSHWSDLPDRLYTLDRLGWPKGSYRGARRFGKNHLLQEVEGLVQGRLGWYIRVRPASKLLIKGLDHSHRLYLWPYGIKNGLVRWLLGNPSLTECFDNYFAAKEAMKQLPEVTLEGLLETTFDYTVRGPWWRRVLLALPALVIGLLWWILMSW